MSRLSTLLPPALILSLAAWVAYVSFTAEPAAAFAFPRLVAAVFLALSLWVMISALGAPASEAPIPRLHWINIIPGLVISALFVFWLAKGLGFYTSAGITVFVLLSIYDPNPWSAPMTWIRRLLITGIFIAIMYLVFAQLLGVFTPREVLF